jgi:hypothetical protein
LGIVPWGPTYFIFRLMPLLLPGTAQRYRIGVASLFYVPFLRYPPKIMKLHFPKLAGHITEIAVVAKVLIIASAVTFHAGVRESFVTVMTTETAVFPFPSVARAIPNVVFLGVGVWRKFAILLLIANKATRFDVCLPISLDCLAFTRSIDAIAECLSENILNPLNLL